MGGFHDICHKLTPIFEIMLIKGYIIFNKIEISEFLEYYFIIGQKKSSKGINIIILMILLDYANY